MHENDRTLCCVVLFRHGGASLLFQTLLLLFLVRLTDVRHVGGVSVVRHEGSGCSGVVDIEQSDVGIASSRQKLLVWSNLEAIHLFMYVWRWEENEL